MKKITLILICVLTGLFGVLTVLAPESDYTAEKQLWRINKKLHKITRNPQKTSYEEYDDVILRYQTFLQEFPKTSLAPHVHMLLGDVHLFKKDYAAARQKYEEIAQIFANQPPIAVQAMVKIIDSYYEEEYVAGDTALQQKEVTKTVDTLFDENLKEKASSMLSANYKKESFQMVLKVYDQAMDRYPTTPLGIQAPFLIAKLWHDQKEENKSKKALDEAIEYYQIFSQKHKDTFEEFQAQEFLVSCYLIQKNLRKAIDTLGEILLRFSGKQYLTTEKTLNVVKLINTLSLQVQDVTPALKIYQQFLATYPHHPFIPTLKENIQELQL